MVLHRPTRLFCRVFAAAIVAGVAFTAIAAGSAKGRIPEVVRLEPTPAADIVVLSGGLSAGLREGMVCRIVRDGSEVGELVLVDLRAEYSTALIVKVAPNQMLRSGDLVTVKVFKS